MKTDRELLELAAKAAGYKTRGYAELSGDIPALVRCDDDFTGMWTPLYDDGDRYRLAKQLDIRIHFGPRYVTYVANGISGVVTWPEDAKDDAYAIVAAAAAIGEAM